MNKILKAGGLLVILAIPVLVFIFLKSFGVNHYSIPVFYDADTTVNLTGCPDFSLPHHLDAEKYFQKTIFKEQNFLVFSTIDAQEVQELAFEKVGQLARFDDAIAADDYKIITLINTSPEIFRDTFTGVFAPSDQWTLLQIEPNKLQEFARCGLILPDDETKFSNNQLVLVDHNRMIRGYYEGDSREEVDRLILETKILLREQDLD